MLGEQWEQCRSMDMVPELAGCDGLRQKQNAKNLWTQEESSDFLLMRSFEQLVAVEGSSLWACKGVGRQDLGPSILEAVELQRKVLVSP